MDGGVGDESEHSREAEEMSMDEKETAQTSNNQKKINKSLKVKD